MSDIHITTPRSHDNWDDLLVSTPGYSFFHSSAWAKVLEDSYAFQPVYFGSMDKNQFDILVPLMEIKSILTGKRAISLPFSDHCSPIAPDPKLIKPTMEMIIRHGRRAQWRDIEIRGGRELPRGFQQTTSFFTHMLDLSPGEDNIFRDLRDSTRRNIKKAQRRGVQVAIHRSLPAVKAFFQLNLITRKRHGLPPQPMSFFKNIHKHVIEPGLGFVVLASYKAEHVAAALFFCFGEKSYFKFGASDKQYDCLRANNLVMWKAIEWLSRNGLKSLDLGRTEKDNAGLLQFKNGWRPQQDTIKYFRYSFTKQKSIQYDMLVKRYAFLIKRMPNGALRILGALLHRHVA